MNRGSKLWCDVKLQQAYYFTSSGNFDSDSVRYCTSLNDLSEIIEVKYYYWPGIPCPWSWWPLSWEQHCWSSLHHQPWSSNPSSTQVLSLLEKKLLVFVVLFLDLCSWNRWLQFLYPESSLPGASRRVVPWSWLSLPSSSEAGCSPKVPGEAPRPGDSRAQLVRAEERRIWPDGRAAYTGGLWPSHRRGGSGGSGRCRWACWGGEGR